AVLDRRAGARAGLVDLERLAAAVAAAVVAVAAVDGLVAVVAGGQAGAQRAGGHRPVGGDRLGLAGGGGAGAVVGRVQVVGEGAGQAERAVSARDRAGVVHLVAEVGVGRVVDRGAAVLDRRAGARAGLVDLERLAAAVSAAVVAVAAVHGPFPTRPSSDPGAQRAGGHRPVGGDRLGLAGG